MSNIAMVYSCSEGNLSDVRGWFILHYVEWLWCFTS